MERIADLYFPGIIWCVNGIAIHGNGMSVMCAGSGGMDCVNFGYIDGGVCSGPVRSASAYGTDHQWRSLYG